MLFFLTSSQPTKDDTEVKCQHTMLSNMLDTHLDQVQWWFKMGPPCYTYHIKRKIVFLRVKMVDVQTGKYFNSCLCNSYSSVILESELPVVVQNKLHLPLWISIF